ncbi:MAG: DUF3891 family protein [Anaerolineae bacterium]|nr:DUF3891 family protein [Anaerolineae bacterium]MDQ7035771.1 DUF3891 family protein [Anaerolineae bacterium]
MFKSKTRPIVLPQSEHARLAGLLAYQWGNTNFDRPAINFDSFVKGVAVHDRGYDVLDNAPIDGVSLTTWLSIMRQSLLRVCDDMTTNIVCWMHVRRLLALASSPERDKLRQMADEMLNDAINQLGIEHDVFVWADSITNFCDAIAFHYGFDTPKQRSMDICYKVGSMERVSVQYWLKADGLIQVDPWPFKVDSISGFVMGYQEEGYPDRLEPVLLPFSIEQP